MPHQVKEEMKLSDLTFLETIHKGEYSKIYKVEYQGRDCVLKVYHGEEENEEKKRRRNRETNIFKCESVAYRRLKETGCCEKGIVPDFYGAIIDIEPKRWPQLGLFHDDKYPANAVLIEYVPGMQRIHTGNYSAQRMDKLKEYLAEMHAARVLHDDIHPRNMAVAINDGQERVLWIDFDRAQTYSRDGTLTEDAEYKFRVEEGFLLWWATKGQLEGGEEWKYWKTEMTLPQRTVW